MNTDAEPGTAYYAIIVLLCIVLFAVAAWMASGSDALRLDCSTIERKGVHYFLPGDDGQMGTIDDDLLPAGLPPYCKEKR